MYKCGKKCTLKDKDCPGEGFVGKNCKCFCPGNPIKQCGGTTVKPDKKCTDMHGSCSYWAAMNQCQKFPGFMLKNCRRACKMCDNVGPGIKRKSDKILLIYTGHKIC